MRLLPALLSLVLLSSAQAETPGPTFDADQAKAWGADEYGMRKYVFVLLKTGPKRMPDGPARSEMFKGHFANIQRLAKEGVLAYAGPMDGVEGWRGIFVFAAPDIETAKRYTETDPVIVEGEMVAEYHVHYGSAALMGVNAAHLRVQKKSF